MIIDLDTLKTFRQMASSFATLNWYHVAISYWEWKFHKAGLQDHFANLENSKLHYWSGGKGTPLLLLHGFGMNAVLYWPNQVSAMAKKYSLIVPDLVWFGESTSDKEDYTVDFQAQAMEQLLDRLKIKELHIMGHSYGGLVSAMLATKLGERVGKLVLVDSPAAPFTVTEEVKEGFRQELHVKGAVDLFVPQTVSDMRRLIHLGYYSPPYIPRFVLKNVLPHYQINVKQRISMADYMEDNFENLFLRSGYHITQDTLVVWGEHDALTHLDVGERVVAAIGPKATFRVIPATGHGPNVEKPTQFNRLVLDFLRSH